MTEYETIDTKTICDEYGCTPCTTCLKCIYQNERDNLENKIQFHHIPESYFDKHGGIFKWKITRIIYFECVNCRNNRRFGEFMKYYDN